MSNNQDPSHRKLIAAILIANFVTLVAFAFSLFSISNLETMPQTVVNFALFSLWGISAALISGLMWFVSLSSSKVSKDQVDETNRLKLKNRELSSQISSLEVQKLDLISEREEAYQTSKQKSDFLANMSHEIRTPMTGVLGMADLLSDTQLNDEQAGFVRTIRNSGESLLTIINDILDFSKIESGKLDMESLSFDLRRSMEEVLELTAHKAFEKEVEVILDFQSSAPEWISGDVTRIKQIATNLLSNASKFTETGEIVLVVSAEHQANKEELLIQFAVRDTGIGIPADRMSRLFQSFSQVDSSTSRRFGGTGLGLVISKRLAEMMGGTMWVESQADFGSTFYFTISAPTAEQSEQHFSTTHLNALKGKKALLVQSNHSNRNLVSSMFDEWDISYDATPSAIHAFELLKGNPRKYDFLLIDYKLDDINGLEFIETLRSKYTALPPLMIFTTIQDIFFKQQVEHLKIEKVLYKPIKKIPLFLSISNQFVKNLTKPSAKKSVTPDEKVAIAHKFPLNILLAEDNIVNQKVALRTLNRLGYQVDVANNGQEAVDKVENGKFDLVLMDIHMPELDGIEATEVIYKMDHFTSSHPPTVIALTAGVMAEEREKCIKAGMDDFVMKPFKAQEIASILQKVAQKRGKFTQSA